MFMMSIVRLRVVSACLVLVEKLMRLGELISATVAFVRMRVVREEKTATLWLCLTRLALRRELLWLM